MFTLILWFWIGTGGPDDPSWGDRELRIRYATAEECIAARDWWMQHPQEQPKGWAEGWRLASAGGADCVDRRGELVRGYSGAPVG